MNVNPLVIQALSPLHMPVVPNVYEGTATEYITFNYVDERPAICADDEDILDDTTIRINYFTRSNPQIIKKAIRRSLRAVGFSIASTQELYEADTKFTHVIVEASIGGAVDDD